MMLSAESFAAQSLAGKTVPELEAVIRELRSEMRALRRTIASPSYALTPQPKPDAKTVLCMDREYLAAALAALEAAKTQKEPATHPGRIFAIIETSKR